VQRDTVPLRFSRSQLGSVELLKPDPCCPAYRVKAPNEFPGEKMIRDGLGPSSQIAAQFRLAEELDFRVFHFQTDSWPRARDLPRDQTEALGQPSLARALMERVKFEVREGARAGETVFFYKPVLIVKLSLRRRRPRTRKGRAKPLIDVRLGLGLGSRIFRQNGKNITCREA
jgi:hypothetical protein